MAPRETENNAYAKFWGDKQRALWYVTVFLEWSVVGDQTQVSHGVFTFSVLVHREGISRRSRAVTAKRCTKLS